MKLRKSFAVLLSTLCLACTFSFPVHAEEKWKVASTTHEVKEIVKDNDVAMIDPKQADIDEILDGLGIGLKFESEDETEQLEALAIMADDEQYVPIYLYGKKNGWYIRYDVVFEDSNEQNTFPDP